MTGAEEMEKLTCREFKPGRRFAGRLPHAKDVIQSLETFCSENNIRMGTFSLIGAVSCATIGAYDQKQQVYITFRENRELEIISCTGNISLKDGNPFIHAHIALGNHEGKTVSGHLFSDTLVFAGEAEIQEFIGKPLERSHDDTTGLMLWKF